MDIATRTNSEEESDSAHVLCLRVNRKTGDYALARGTGDDPGRGRHS
jgi:hypothetical protein